MDIKILYEDNHLLVAVKKPGVLSQAGSLDMPDMLSILKDYIKDKYQKPGNVFLGLVHRLDLNVGGVMVFARTSKAAKRLNEQVRNHLFSKKYLAVVLGKMNLDQQVHVLENYIKKDEVHKVAQITESKNDQYAKLTYQVIEQVNIKRDVISLVDISLETGRFHQIRAQFSHIGHPLYGDNKYGPKTLGYELGLYAYELSFSHPITKESLTFIHYPGEGIFKSFIIFGGNSNDSNEN
ncbi:RluA family pseudouridine synthase [Hujiaoplasma nucleasis]|nr:RluA family pseudouridine synthase [Hujiaoplasma nucleasis]